jgi:uncharacterized protein
MEKQVSITKKEVAGWTRWVHIYLSMFSFGALLFFAVTGITLNHPQWIESQQRVTHSTGELTTGWVSGKDNVDELKVVEFLRSKHGIKARLSDFMTDETECSVSFKGPGYAADVFIDRTSGSYELTVAQYGLVAVMNDLHKGRDAGGAWSWIIDISAILMIVVSLTGFVMIYFLRKKRLNGTLLAFAGAILLIIFYYAFAK